MPRAVVPPKSLCNSVRDALSVEGPRRLAARTKVTDKTLLKVARGQPVRAETIEALARAKWSKRKTAEDYRPTMPVRAPSRQRTSVAWPLDKIRSARDAQLCGDFRTSSGLAQAMLLDDAIFTAVDNRVAPLRALGLTLKSAGGVRGDKIQKAALAKITVPRAVLVGIGGTLAVHNVAFGYVDHEASEDGTSVSMALREWPIEHIRWNDQKQIYVARVEGAMAEQEVRHGDGRWIVFSGAALDPFKRACLLPASLIFPAHLDAMRDWAAGSRSHGQAKITGQLAEGVPVQDEDGNLSPDASYFLDVLADIVSGDSGAGLLPAGSSTTFLANGSTAWQVFSELALNREKAAARVFLGTDGTLGSVGGAPGVDIATLFGVATTKVQADVQVIEDALYSGLYIPFAAINFPEGSSRHAPKLVYQMPDADAKQRVEQNAAARSALLDAIDRYKSSGLLVDATVVAELAAEYGVTAPQLAGEGVAPVSIALAPTDVAKVVRVREARASQGLPPFGDRRDDLTITQLETAGEASQDTPTTTQGPQSTA